uniref:Uncharacterized protein n=1 Tax=Opuntia streptacantha TaxID=393608 RepID=A0A7C9A2Q1_OPUST
MQVISIKVTQPNKLIKASSNRKSQLTIEETSIKEMFAAYRKFPSTISSFVDLDQGKVSPKGLRVHIHSQYEVRKRPSSHKCSYIHVNAKPSQKPWQNQFLRQNRYNVITTTMNACSTAQEALKPVAFGMRNPFRNQFNADFDRF